MPKFLTAPFLILAVLSALTLSGCGFALRGLSEDLQIDPDHQTVQLNLDDSQENLHLKQAITKHLKLMHLSTGLSTNQIRVDNLHFRRYELVGTLTEIRLVLSATVKIMVGDKTTTTVMQVEQSYQYNEASVITLDQQGEESKGWLYDQLGERIAERYRVMAR